MTHWLTDIGLLTAVISPLCLGFYLNLKLLRFFDAGLVAPFLLGGYGGVYFGRYSLGLGPAALLGLVIGTFAGFLVYLVLVRPLIKVAASPSRLLLATLGASIVAEQLVSLLFGTTPLIVTGDPPDHIGAINSGAKLTVSSIALFVSLATALWLDGRAGACMRAVMENRELSRTFGLDPAKWMMRGALLASALAAMSGMACGIIFQISPLVAVQTLMMSVGCALLLNRRAVDALSGAALVALLFYGGGFLLPHWQHAIVYSLVLVALLFRRAAAT